MPKVSLDNDVAGFVGGLHRAIAREARRKSFLGMTEIG